MDIADIIADLGEPDIETIKRYNDIWGAHNFGERTDQPAVPAAFAALRTAPRRLLLSQDTYWVSKSGWGCYTTEICQGVALDEALETTLLRVAVGALGKSSIVELWEMDPTWCTNIVNMLDRQVVKLMVGERAHLLADCARGGRDHDDDIDYLEEMLDAGRVAQLAWLHATPLIEALCR